MIRVGELLLRQKNEKKNFYNDRLWLLSSLMKKSQGELFLSKEELVSRQIFTRYESALKKRKRGHPLQYVVGEADFFGRTFFVDERVLIPRPETERMVEIALEQIKEIAPRILDLGTGSGAIGITASLERPNWICTATDISSDALRVAKKNAVKNRAKLQFVKANLLDSPISPSQFDWILSNPPYLDFTRDFIADDVRRHEPRLALEPPGAQRLPGVGERAAWIAERILNACAQANPRPTGVLLELSPRIAFYLERRWKNNSAVLSLERLADLAGRRRFLLLRWKRG